MATELSTNIKTGDLKLTASDETKPEEKKPDLITRVSQVKVEDKSKDEKSKESGIKEPEFDFKDIEAIQDPVAKEQAVKAYKSFQRGFNEKFQELATLRKELETIKTETKRSEPITWTPERIQELLKDPTFVESARSVVEPHTEDNSMLTETEKKELKELKDKVKLMESYAWQATKTQQDEALKVKYANYSAQGVDIITNELLAGKRQATREDLWKAMDYDDAVNRAYELGRQDRKLEVEEKVETSSVGEGTVVSTDVPPPKEKGESDRAYFKRLGERRLAELVSKRK